MGKSRAGILGNWRGRTGNVVARQSQGRTIYSIYQPEVRDAQSSAQLAQRARFSLLAVLAGKLRIALKNTFKSLDGYETGTFQSAFVGYNSKISGIFTGTYPNQVVDFSKLVVSYGNAYLPDGIAAEASESAIGVTWTDNTGTDPDEGPQAADSVYLLVYNPGKKRALGSAAVARSERRASRSYPSSWEGDTLHAWLYVQSSKDDTQYSETYYLGDFEG